MKAMAQRAWGANHPLEPMELPTPSVRARELRVAVKFAGVNPVDWKMRAGGPLGLAARVLGPPPPVVVGVDFAGIVEEVGDGVTAIRAGDRVVGGTDFSRRQRGSMADTVVVRDDQVCVLPESVPLDVAAALPIAGVTAWRAVTELGRLPEGGRALILGASGGVGQFAVQFAKRVRNAFTAGVCSAKNADLVSGLGADQVIDYAAGDPIDQARALAPFDTIVDCVGTYAGPRSRALLAPRGRLVIVAGDSASMVLQTVLAPIRTKAILGRPHAAVLRPVVDAVATGKVTVNIAARFPLAAAEEAHRLSQSGRVVGKIILEI